MRVKVRVTDEQGNEVGRFDVLSERGEDVTAVALARRVLASVQQNDWITATRFPKEEGDNG